MKETRSASQILYGFLPEQTVDLRGDVWKVKEWRNALSVPNIDMDTLRRELLRLVQPWEIAQRDGYLGRALRRGDPLVVYEVNPENGVDVEPFPKQWVCRACKRLHFSADAKCPCGRQALSSFHFVGYHDECGSLREVPLPRCQRHNQVAVRFPGASASAELRFICPECQAELRRGFPRIACSCGKGGFFTFNVHRAAAVFTPRTVVVVNAPKAEQRQAIAQAGGRSRALSWVVEGMQGDVAHAPATEESLRQGLKAQLLPDDVIETLIDTAKKKGTLAGASVVQVPESVRQDAEDQAVSIALASINSRRTIQELSRGTTSGSKLADLYSTGYPAALAAAGLQSVDLMDRFPILTGVFGYTRGDYAPGASALVPFRNRQYVNSLHASLVETEALFWRLDPVAVARWLGSRGHKLNDFHDQASARLAILQICRMPSATDRDGSVHQELFTLIHSYAHRFMRIGANFAGIDRNALAELLVPLHLGFFIYAGARGDFVLGGLQAVFESQLGELLHAVFQDEWRCPMDPGCTKGGGACVGCLHVGEPSCRWYNQLLDRATLFGPTGYLHSLSHSN